VQAHDFTNDHDAFASGAFAWLGNVPEFCLLGACNAAAPEASLMLNKTYRTLEAATKE
jgi:hypothetical protein